QFSARLQPSSVRCRQPTRLAYGVRSRLCNSMTHRSRGADAWQRASHVHAATRQPAVRNDRSRYGNHCINASRSDDRPTEVLRFSGELSREAEAAAAADRKITVSPTARVASHARARIRTPEPDADRHSRGPERLPWLVAAAGDTIRRAEVGAVLQNGWWRRPVSMPVARLGFASRIPRIPLPGRAPRPGGFFPPPPPATRPRGGRRAA